MAVSEIAGYSALSFGLGCILGATIAMNAQYLWVRRELRKARKIWHEAREMFDRATDLIHPSLGAADE